MNFEKEIKDLIKLHNVLKNDDDFYYASYMKDWIQGIKWSLRKERNVKNSEQKRSTGKLAESHK